MGCGQWTREQRGNAHSQWVLTGWQECTSNFGHWCCFRFRFLFLRKFFSGVARKRKRLGASVYMHGVTQRGPTYELTMLQSRLLSSFFLVRRRWGMGLRRR